jgi:hypothetical protein
MAVQFLTVYDGDPEEQSTDHLIRYQKSRAEGVVDRVTGLGDGAVFAVLMHGKDGHEYSLDVVKGGNKYMEVYLFDFTVPEQARSMAIALARKAMANYETGAYKARLGLQYEKD